MIESFFISLGYLYVLIEKFLGAIVCFVLRRHDGERLGESVSQHEFFTTYDYKCRRCGRISDHSQY